ncbi:MAG: hypothetical protein ACLTSX_10590 [Collinsella sp.]
MVGSVRQRQYRLPAHQNNARQPAPKPWRRCRRSSTVFRPKDARFVTLSEMIAPMTTSGTTGGPLKGEDAQEGERPARVVQQDSEQE